MWFRNMISKRGNIKLGSNYELNSINCGDKALSVGEKSFLILNKITAENSDMGIASKDSSITKLDTAYFNNLKINSYHNSERDRTEAVVKFDDAPALKDIFGKIRDVQCIYSVVINPPIAKVKIITL